MSEMENKKRLKSCVKVSDVEKICEMNHERRKAEEYQYTDFGQVETAEPVRNAKRKARERRRALRTAVTACMMATGGGAAFVGIGISDGHWPTIMIGLFIAVAFLLAGCRAEGMLEEGRKDYV